MWRLLQQTFLRSPFAYLQFSLVAGVLFCVNNLELAFARSLVVCDVPVLEGVFTGSRHCGDRILVISQGQRFWSQAQCVEYAVRVFGVLSTALVADRYGRRVLLILGATCLWFSSMVFVLATIDTSRAVMMYYFAQALQGFVNFDLLASIVAGDLTALPGADTESVFMVMFMTTTALRLLGGLVYAIYATNELLNFWELWVGVSATTFGCVLVTLGCRETKPDKGNTEQPLGVMEGIRKEVSEWKEMLQSEPFVRKLTVVSALFTLSDTDSLNTSFLMGTHGLSQRMVTWLMMPYYPHTILCDMSVVFFVQVFGEKRAYLTAKISTQVITLVLFPLLPLSSAIAFTLQYALPLLKGAEGLEMPLNHRCVMEAYSAKSKTFWTLLQNVAMQVPLNVYAHLYDPKAGTYFRQALPFLIALLLRLLGFFLQWIWVWPVYSPELDRMQEERIEAMKKAPISSSSGSGSYQTVVDTLKSWWTSTISWRIATIIGTVLVAIVLTHRVVVGLIAGLAAAYYTRKKRSFGG